MANLVRLSQVKSYQQSQQSGVMSPETMKSVRKSSHPVHVSVKMLTVVVLSSTPLLTKECLSLA